MEVAADHQIAWRNFEVLFCSHPWGWSTATCHGNKPIKWRARAVFQEKGCLWPDNRTKSDHARLTKRILHGQPSTINLLSELDPCVSSLNFLLLQNYWNNLLAWIWSPKPLSSNSIIDCRSMISRKKSPQRRCFQACSDYWKKSTREACHRRWVGAYLNHSHQVFVLWIRRYPPTHRYDNDVCICNCVFIQTYIHMYRYKHT